MDFQGSQWKKIENSRGVTVNFTGNPGGSTSKESISSTGGVTIFFWKSPILKIAKLKRRIDELTRKRALDRNRFESYMQRERKKKLTS